MLRRQTVTISGNSSQSCTGYTDAVVNGFLVGLQFTTGASTASTGVLGTTGKIAITGERTGLAYYANTTGGAFPSNVFPVCQLSSTAGTILGDTTAPLVSFFPVVEERIKIETSGGTSDAAYLLYVNVLTQGA